MGKNDDADLIFVNGAVYTRRRGPVMGCERSAVRSGRIVAVGTEDDVRPLAGASTEVVDLAGGMLVPGFQDAHVHPVLGGLDMLQCDLHDLATQRGLSGGDQGVRGGSSRA